jgi:hypothetical protein
MSTAKPKSMCTRRRSGSPQRPPPPSGTAISATETSIFWLRVRPPNPSGPPRSLSVNPRLVHLGVRGVKVDHTLFGIDIPGAPWNGSATGDRWIDFTHYLADSNNNYQIRLNFLGLGRPDPGPNVVKWNGTKTAPSTTPRHSWKHLRLSPGSALPISRLRLQP